MTIERRFVVSLADVKAVTLRCESCGTRITYKPSDDVDIPVACPLNHRWESHAAGNRGPALRLINALQDSLKGTRQGFELLLEFEAPTP
jgi:DNA-directed RNA polymerase subunit RPC12/RpoP